MSEQPSFSEPEPLRPDHEIDQFSCGEPLLDDWLHLRAMGNDQHGASRTYVICLKRSKQVIGYYALATGAVMREKAPGAVRRNMPEPIPVMVLGRLAIDQTWQGHKLGRGLLRDAILRTLKAAEIAGIRALLVHAISDRAKTFYEQAGFKVSPIDPYLLMLNLKEAKNLIAAMMN